MAGQRGRSAAGRPRSDPAADAPRRTLAGRGLPARLRRPAAAAAAHHRAWRAGRGAADLGRCAGTAAGRGAGAATGRAHPADPGDGRRRRCAAHRRSRLEPRRRTGRADGRGGAGGDRSVRAAAGGGRPGLCGALGADAGIPAHRHPRLAGLAGRAAADEPGGSAGGAAQGAGCRLGARAARDRVLVAGTTGGIPAVARLLGVVARLPTGRGVVARPRHRHGGGGLGRTGRGASSGRAGAAAPWAGRDARRCPPMAGRGDRECAGCPHARRLPAPCCRPEPWTNGGTPDRSRSMELSLLSTADQQEEAAAIAMVLRAALEAPGRPGGPGHPGPEPCGTGRGRIAALRRGGRRQRRREAVGYSAGGVPAPAGPCRRRGTGARASAGVAEAPAGRGRAVALRLPCGCARAWNLPACVVRGRALG